jgi:hypothetical protein
MKTKIIAVAIAAAVYAAAMIALVASAPAHAAGASAPDAQAVEQFAFGIGDPRASNDPAVVAAEQVWLVTHWCPFAAPLTLQQQVNAVDPDGTPIQRDSAREVWASYQYHWCG